MFGNLFGDLEKFLGVNQPAPKGNTIAPKPVTTPPPQQKTVSSPAKTPSPSVVHQITHNPITNIVGGAVKFIPQFSEDYSNTFANLGRKLAGAKPQTIQQNMGTDPINKAILKASGATGKNSQLASDVAQTAIAAGTPAVGKVVEGALGSVASKLAGKVAPKILSTGVKYGKNTIEGAITNAALNASQTAGNGGTKKDVEKAALQGLGTGAAVGAGGTAVGSLAKAIASHARASQNVGSVIEKSTPSKTTPSEKVSPLTSGKKTVDKMEKPAISGKQPKPQVPQQADKVPQVNRSSTTSVADTKSYASAFGISEDQAKKELSSVNNGPTEEQITSNREKATQTAPPADTGKGVGGLTHQKAAPLTAADKAALIANEEAQQTTNKISLDTKEGNTRGAIAEATGLANERMSRFNAAERLATGGTTKTSKAIANETRNTLDLHDQKLLSERADPSVKINPHNSALFDKVSKAYDDAYDYSLAADRAAGGNTMRYGNGKYAPLYLKATPKEMDSLGIPAEQRLQGKHSGFRDTNRIYKSYTDAGKHGLQPLNKSPIEDAKMYAEKGHNPIRNNLLKATLQKSNPHDVAEHGYGLETTKTGAQIPFTQAAGKLPFDVSSKVNAQLKNFRGKDEPTTEAGKVALKVAKTANNTAKRVLFAGSPFHVFNVLPKYAGATLASGRADVFAKGIGKALPATISKDIYDRVASSARADGTMDYAAKNGLVLSSNSNSYLDRLENTLGLQLARAAKDGGVESGSSEATKLFEQYNNIITKVNGATSNISPKSEQISSVVNLAPGYLRTQLGPRGSVIGAAKFGAEQGHGLGLTKAGNAARSTVIGQRAVEASLAIVASAIASGHLPTIRQAINEAGFNLNNPIPNVQLGQKTQPQYKGQQTKGQVTEMPTDPLGLAAGFATDPTHFLQSRLSPLLSFGTKVATNTNWNGNPIADKNASKGQYVKQLLEGAAENSLLPIGVQNFTNVTKNPNNPNIRQGIIQDVGGRIKTDPNDPVVKAQTQYYKALDKASSSLPAGSQEQGAFLENFGVTKDPTTGKYLMTPNSEQTVAKTSALNAYPAALKAATQMNLALQKEGQKIDPFYNLTTAQQKAYNAYETMAPLSADRTDWQNKNNSWYKPFSQKQSAYFDSLPAGDPSKPTNPIKFPTASTSTQNDLNTYNKITDSTQKGQFLDSHTDVTDFFNSTFNYDNAVRQARGYAPMKGAPQPSASLQKFMTNYNNASTADRKGIRNANPKEYQSMIAFYDSADLNTIGKQAAVSQLQGEPGTSSQELKDITSLSQDIYKNADGTYSIVPAGWVNGLTNGSSYSSSGKRYSSGSSGSSKAFKVPNTSFSTADKALSSLIRATSKSESTKLPKSFTGRVGSSKMKTNYMPKTPKFPKVMSGTISKKNIKLSA